MASTLLEYYKSKGQGLPTIDERAKTFEQAGLGKSSDYLGTRDQNISLLNRLNAMPVTPAPTAAPATAPASPGMPATMSLYGTSVPTYTSLLDTFRKSLGLDTLENTISQGFNNAPKKADIYAQETAVLAPEREQLKSLDTRLAAMKDAIGSSEADIRKRITDSGGVVTESQVQRLLAAETNPLLKSYNSLLDSRNALASSLSSDTAQAEKVAALKAEDAAAPASAAQSQYKMLSDLLGTMFGAAGKDLTAQISAAKESADVPTSLTEVNGRRVLINSKTGQVIKDLGSSAAPTSTAPTGGGTIQSGTTAPVGSNGKPLKLTASQVDTLAGFDNTVQSANDALTLLGQGVSTGPISGNFLQLQKLFGIAPENKMNLEQKIGKIRADFMKAISGAAVSEAEVKRLSAFLPSITDQESVIKSKLENLTNEVAQARTNYLNRLGASNTGASADTAQNGGQNNNMDSLRTKYDY